MQINEDLLIKNNNIIYASDFKCKNLLDESNLSVSAKSVGITYDGNKVYSTTPASDTRQWNYDNANYYITLDAGTYTLSLNFIHKITNSSGGLFRFYKEDNTFLGNLSAYNVDNASITFTLVATTKLGFYFKLYDGQVNIQIESGNEETPYVKFKEFENINIKSSNVLYNNNSLDTFFNSLLKCTLKYTTDGADSVSDSTTKIYQLERNGFYLFIDSHPYNNSIGIINGFNGNVKNIIETSGHLVFTYNSSNYQMTVRTINGARFKLYKIEGQGNT